MSRRDCLCREKGLFSGTETFYLRTVMELAHMYTVQSSSGSTLQLENSMNASYTSIKKIKQKKMDEGKWNRSRFEAYSGDLSHQGALIRVSFCQSVGRMMFFNGLITMMHLLEAKFKNISRA